MHVHEGLEPAPQLERRDDVQLEPINVDFTIEALVEPIRSPPAPPLRAWAIPAIATVAAVGSPLSAWAPQLALVAVVIGFVVGARAGRRVDGVAWAAAAWCAGAWATAPAAALGFSGSPWVDGGLLALAVGGWAAGARTRRDAGQILLAVAIARLGLLIAQVAAGAVLFS